MGKTSSHFGGTNQMTANRSSSYLEGLLLQLAALPKESEWVEFKENFVDPEDIGEYISALSNSAALIGKPLGYMAWGVSDSGALVGTNFSPSTRKIGNEELENWLLRQLTPKINFQFHALRYQDMNFVVLEIEAAFRHPVRFKSTAFIRIGSYKKLLKDFPQKERELWRTLDKTPFEKGIAIDRVNDTDVLSLIDYSSYFDLLKAPLPQNRVGILECLQADKIIVKSEAGGWDITNLGAVLLAKKLSDFPSISRKAQRVIIYRGNDRLETEREHIETRGYAGGFEGLVSLILSIIPSNEHIEKALRKVVPVYPALAIREILANALIHQDFMISGSGPMIEIFKDRIEFSNPGQPLVDTARFLDTPPRSRNEALASMMYRFGICEERGSGIDKIVAQTELFQLPAPIFEVPDHSTRAVLFSPRPLNRMDKDDRVRACYFHACLKYVSRDFLTNASLRERFGIEQKNSATVSRIIKESLDAGAIVPFDASAAPKLMKYVPWWAGPART